MRRLLAAAAMAAAAFGTIPAAAQVEPTIFGCLPSSIVELEEQGSRGHTWPMFDGFLEEFGWRTILYRAIDETGATYDVKQHQVHILNDTNEPNISATVTQWWFFADDPAAPNARYRVESRTFLGLKENFRDVECHTGRP